MSRRAEAVRIQFAAIVRQFCDETELSREDLSELAGFSRSYLPNGLRYPEFFTDSLASRVADTMLSLVTR